MKIALAGYGKMGKMIENVADRYDLQVVEHFMDVKPLKVDETTRKSLKNVSVLIDFSVSEAVLKNIRACADLSINIVVGTTGWHSRLEEAFKIVEEGKIGLVYASNFSLGINLYYKIIEHAAEIISSFESYDPFIEESHHKFKKDAPSGTAILLKNILEEKYKKKPVPVTSVRAGYIPSIHTVSFDSIVDTISLKHTARNREGFAEGAIFAAKWIAERKGFYEFREVLESMLQKSKSKIEE